MQRAEAVAVGLDHGQERHAGARRNGSPVAAQRAQVDLDPGACHRDGAVRYHVKTEQDTEPEESDARKAGTRKRRSS